MYPTVISERQPKLATMAPPLVMEETESPQYLATLVAGKTYEDCENSVWPSQAGGRAIVLVLYQTVFKQLIILFANSHAKPGCQACGTVEGVQSS